MSTYFLNLMKSINLLIQQGQQTPRRENTNRPTPKHTIVKLLKDNEKTQKLTRKKNHTKKESQYN